MFNEDGKPLCNTGRALQRQKLPGCSDLDSEVSLPKWEAKGGVGWGRVGEVRSGGVLMNPIFIAEF